MTTTTLSYGAKVVFAKICEQHPGNLEARIAAVDHYVGGAAITAAEGEELKDMFRTVQSMAT